jgi:hypothetical protein
LYFVAEKYNAFPIRLNEFKTPVKIGYAHDSKFPLNNNNIEQIFKPQNIIETSYKKSVSLVTVSPII